jgi:YmdB-like protein
MRVLFVGDVVGPRGRMARIAPARAEERASRRSGVIDAENCAPDGASMTVAGVEELFAAGVDVITGGNHAFEGPEVEAVLGHERVLRPLNVPSSVPGRGHLTLRVAGEDLRVVVLADRFAVEVGPRTTQCPAATTSCLGEAEVSSSPLVGAGRVRVQWPRRRHVVCTRLLRPARWKTLANERGTSATRALRWPRGARARRRRIGIALILHVSGMPAATAS